MINDDTFSGVIVRMVTPFLEKLNDVSRPIISFVDSAWSMFVQERFAIPTLASAFFATLTTLLLAYAWPDAGIGAYAAMYAATAFISIVFFRWEYRGHMRQQNQLLVRLALRHASGRREVLDEILGQIHEVDGGHDHTPTPLEFPALQWHTLAKPGHPHDFFQEYTSAEPTPAWDIQFPEHWDDDDEDDGDA